MIDVMVDIMVMATGTGTGMGGNNNNNNNNNNNRKKRETAQDNMEIYDNVLDSFLENPSNQSMIHHYEHLAKNHMDQYLDILLKNPPIDFPKKNSNLIGSRVKSLQK